MSLCVYVCKGVFFYVYEYVVIGMLLIVFQCIIYTSTHKKDPWSLLCGKVKTKPNGMQGRKKNEMKSLI